MDKANVAEWILRRLVSPSRATEIVGDLLESRADGSQVLSYLSFIGVVIALTWRSVVGVIAASIASVLLAWLPFVYVFTRLSFDPRANFYNMHSTFYIFFGMLLWISVIFSLIRFGARSHVAQLGLVAAFLEAIATCTYWLPKAMAIQCVTASLLLVATLFTPRGRKVAVILAAAWLAGAAMLYVIGRLPLSGKSSGFLIISLGELFTVTLVECGALSLIHRRLVRDPQ